MPTPQRPDLPVLALEDRLLGALRARAGLVLGAPTGSGKTTQVPQMLLRAGYGKVLVLQPRRLAARLVAERVAAECGEEAGGTVGYATRFASRQSAETRLLFCTEGVFLRLLQDDPALKGCGAVVLDEFHERSLAADVALGLLRRLQRGARPDLRVVLMSATLDTDTVAQALDCPALVSEGRTFPIETTYRSRPREEAVWQAAAAAVGQILETHAEGDVLVFMPGAYEIRRTLEACSALGSKADLLPLYSALPAAQQDAAVVPGPRRKVVVSTNVAETSITIPGVRHVVDSGLARVARHDPRRGLNALLVEPISGAAADQRAGRAGRTAPGTCVRLWSEEENARRPARDLPEVHRLELSETLLQLHVLGIEDPLRLGWLDPPRPAALAAAEGLLRGLGALEEDGRLSALGRRMARLPLHPRLSRLLLAAAERGCAERAALWAALLSEPDIVRRPPAPQYSRPGAGGRACDLEVREAAWRRLRRGRFASADCSRAGLHADACRQVDRARTQYLRLLRRAGAADSGGGDDEALQQSLLAAYFDQVALRPDPEGAHCVMAGRSRVEIGRTSAARSAAALVALDARETEAGRDGVRTVVSLASEIDTEWLLELFPDRIEEKEDVRWNESERAVEHFETMEYAGLVFYRRQRRPDPDRAATVLVGQIRQGQVRLDGWDRDVEGWIARCRFVGRLFPERGLVAYDEEDLELVLHEIVRGATRASHLRRRPCLPAVVQALSWDDQQFVEKTAPTRIKLPSGYGMRLHYGENGREDDRVVGRAKIQDFYGMEETPTVGRGRQKVLLEILGPNFRPVQVTDDLAGFWRRTYPEVKKELKRRYPKHEWR